MGLKTSSYSRTTEPFLPRAQALKQTHPALSSLRLAWEKTRKNLPESLLREPQFRGLEQRFRAALSNTTLERTCQSLLELAQTAEGWEALQEFREQVLQWVLAQACSKNLKERASRALRELRGNPNSFCESVQFLAHDVRRHPVRLSLLAGIGAAGFGMRMGRLAGTAWAKARGLGTIGQFVAKASTGFGAELGFFSVGTRAGHFLEDEKIDWSASAIGQEMLSGLFLLGPMKLFNPLAHFSRTTGAARYLQAGTAHFLGAGVGTWASARVNGQSLTGYQIFSGATHLMIEGALASRTLGTLLPGLQATHRALDLKTHAMLRQSLSTALNRAKGFWERPLGGHFPMGPREALAEGMKYETLTLPKQGAPINQRELLIAKQDARKINSQTNPRLEEANRLLNEVIDSDQHQFYPRLMRMLEELRESHYLFCKRAKALLAEYQAEYGEISWREETVIDPHHFEKPRVRPLKLALLEHRGDLESIADSLGLTLEQLGETLAEYGRADALLRHPERFLLPLKTEADFAQFEPNHWDWFFTYAEVIHGRALHDIIIDYNVYSSGDIERLEVHPADRLPSVEKDRKIRVRKVSEELYEILMLRGSREIDFVSTMADSPAALNGHLWIPPVQFLIARRQQYEGLQPEFLRGLTAGILDRMYEEYADKSRAEAPLRQFSLVLNPSGENNSWQGRIRAWRQERYSEGDIVVRIKRNENNETEQAANSPRYSIDGIFAPEKIPVAKYLAGSDAVLSGVLAVSNVAPQPKLLLPGERAVLRLARQAYDMDPFEITEDKALSALLIEGRFPRQITGRFKERLRKLLQCLESGNGEHSSRIVENFFRRREALARLEKSRYLEDISLQALQAAPAGKEGVVVIQYGKYLGSRPRLFPLGKENPKRTISKIYVAPTGEDKTGWIILGIKGGKADTRARDLEKNFDFFVTTENSFKTNQPNWNALEERRTVHLVQEGDLAQVPVIFLQALGDFFGRKTNKIAVIEYSPSGNSFKLVPLKEENNNNNNNVYIAEDHLARSNHGSQYVILGFRGTMGKGHAQQLAKLPYFATTPHSFKSRQREWDPLKEKMLYDKGKIGVIPQEWLDISPADLMHVASKEGVAVIQFRDRLGGYKAGHNSFLVSRPQVLPLRDASPDKQVGKIYLGPVDNDGKKWKVLRFEGLRAKDRAQTLPEELPFIHYEQI